LGQEGNFVHTVSIYLPGADRDLAPWATVHSPHQPPSTPNREYIIAHRERWRGRTKKGNSRLLAINNWYRINFVTIADFTDYICGIWNEISDTGEPARQHPVAMIGATSEKCGIDLNH